MTKKRDQETESEVRDGLMRRIRTEGVIVAYDTALGICRDPRAPAPAKATALTALFRVGGYFDKSDTSGAKELHEMDAAELTAATSKMLRKIEALNGDGAAGAETDEAGVFG
jgi:hypothetical protein